MAKPDENVPFYRLFKRLRAEGFDISPDEFLLLPRLLQVRGVPIYVSDWIFMLKKIWLKSDERHAAFENEVRTFLQQYADAMEEEPKQSKQDTKVSGATEEVQQPESGRPEATETPEETFDEVQETVRITIQHSDASRYIPAGDDGPSGAGGPFLLKGNYFPLKENHLRQAWLYLKQADLQRNSPEIDIPASVARFARETVLTKPVYATKKNTQIILLADNRGSMEPFAKLTELISESFHEAHIDLKLYYFYNSPAFNLYTDRRQANPVTLESLGRQPDAFLFVVSDAGAARGDFHTKRLERNREDYARCRAITKRVAWLNPVPHNRWKKTTANHLAQFLPMFEANRNGLMNAVRHVSKIV